MKPLPTILLLLAGGICGYYILTGALHAPAMHSPESSPSLSATSNSMQTANATDDKTIVIEHGTGTPQHAIIWLHGLGATANDFPPVVPHLGLSADRAIRFVFPQAPDRPITINNGLVMPGWYDIKGLDISGKEDLPGMSKSRDTLEYFIQEQIDKGVPASHIIVAGFSQGGAVAYYTAIRSRHSLAGVLALSTYLPFEHKTAEEFRKANTEVPIFASHGSFDPVVPVQMGKSSVEALEELGFTIKWSTYPMEHSVVLEQLQDIGRWINQVFDTTTMDGN